MVKSWLSSSIEAVLYRDQAGARPSRLRLAACALWSYRQRYKSWPNVIRPRTFHEKTQARKIFDRDPRIPQLANKILVKNHVRATLGEEWNVPTLWHGTKLPPRDKRDWPIPFVIKASHASGWNYFVRSNKDLDWPHIEKLCGEWMASAFGIRTGEWHYTRTTPELIVEPFLCPGGALPVDYKFWVFHGHATLSTVVTRRDKDMRLTMFDRHWRRFEAQDADYQRETLDLPKPQAYDSLVAAAERLAQDLPFVRVDFYEIDGKPLVGEMTFYPGAGLDILTPKDFDQLLLSFWNDPAAARRFSQR